jgi:uroporphyrinogen III methyltransferase/synthase
VNPLIKRIFISKNAEELPALSSFCEVQKISLHAHSLLRFEALEFTVKQPFDIVFFSSIRAAEFFLAHTALDGALVACIGKTTAEKLRHMGINPSFIGTGAGEPAQVAEAFKAFVGDRRVLIPCSDISARSIASTLPAGRVEEIVVYKTLAASVPVSECEVYVFTSPSSLDAFLRENDVPKGHTIAWGTTTAAQLTRCGIDVSRVLKTASEEELVEVLSSLLK